MTENDIILQGETAKYIIASARADLDLTTVSFAVRLEYGMMGRSKTIESIDMDIVAGTSNYLLTFDTTDMVGKVNARLLVDMPDRDIAGGVRKEVDAQIISFVVATPCPKLLSCSCPSTTGHDVTYTRTEDSDVTSLYDRLCDCNHNPIRDRHGNYLFVLKS